MARYSVYVNKCRPKEYGAADFYLGKAKTLTEAKQMIKRNTRNGDSYCIAYGNADYNRRANQCRTGTVYGSGSKKICKDGYTPKFLMRGDEVAKSRKPIACKPMSNWGGIEIMYADSDKVIARDNYGTPRRAHGAKVRYNAKGEPYFKHNGRREYLRDYLRCN